MCRLFVPPSLWAPVIIIVVYEEQHVSSIPSMPPSMRFTPIATLSVIVSTTASAVASVVICHDSGGGSSDVWGEDFVVKAE